MASPDDNLIARLSGAQITELEGELARITKAKQKARLRGSEDDIKEVAADVIAVARSGVKIAPQTESRPLIPLFEAANTPLPPEMKVDHEKMGFVFYSVEIVFSILLPQDQWAQSADFHLNLSDDITEPARRLRPIRIFPDYKDITFFKVDLDGAVGIDAGLNVKIPLQSTAIVPFANFSAEAKVKAGIVVGPLSFPFRKTAIEVTGESDQEVFWRYNLQTQLRGTNIFKSILILKVAEEAKTIQISAELGVVPCKRRWLLFGRENLPRLTDQRPLPVQLALR